MHNLACSFCGHTLKDGTRDLIAGPQVFICDQCVPTCVDILKKRKAERMPHQGADHGDFPILHREICNQVQSWLNEFCQREHGFKLSELQNAESWIARLTAIEDPTPEAKEELQKALTRYREHWLPLRKKLDSQ